VNREQDLNQETREAIRDIQEGISLLGQNKGKQSKGLRDSVRQQWSQSIAKIFSDATCPLDPFLQDVGSIPPSVTARGAVTAWPTMSDERRTAYLRWVDTLDADRSGSQKAVLIPRLLHSSPATSIELLCNVSLANQDVKGRLASSLLGDSILDNELLLPAAAPDYRVRKVLICLLQLCETPKVTAEAKWETIRLTLVTLIGRNLHTDSLGNSLLNQIATQMLNLPPFLKEKIRSLLLELAPQLNARFFPGEEAEPQTTGDPKRVEDGTPVPHDAFEPAPPMATEAASDQTTSPASPLGHTPPPFAEAAEDGPRSGLLGQLTEWLTSLKDRTRILEALHQHISSLETRQAALESELRTAGVKAEEERSAAAKAATAQSAAEERIRILEHRLKQNSQSAALTQEHAATLETRITTLAEQESAVRKQLQAQEDKATNERSELQQRIQTNAERRIEEFRTGVGGSLGRLLHGLPRRGTPVSGELGEMILTRLYEILDFLETKGIRTNSLGDRR
jgi:hypothetical protein